jgi:DNA-directed RNA polymerase sigma subunit (sigma70/sigma32)
MNSVENRISFIQNGQKRIIKDNSKPSVSKSSYDKLIKSDGINPVDIYLEEIGRYPLLTFEQEKHSSFTLKAGQQAWFELKRKVLSNHLKRNVKSELEVLLAESINITDEKELESKLKQESSSNGRKTIKSYVADLDSGRKSFDLLVNSNLRLVVAVAKKYNKKPENLLDLIQEGNSGLIRAIQKFDPNKNNRYHKISTYAT